MRRYKNEQEKLPEQVICNGCGRELRLERGYLKEGCFQADTIFDYFSKKDGVRHRFDLCEECYDRLVGQFLIPVEETVENELL